MNDLILLTVQSRVENQTLDWMFVTYLKPNKGFCFTLLWQEPMECMSKVRFDHHEST